MRILGHRNADCVKCKIVLLHMVRVGAIIMCPNCLEEEFKSDDPVKKERGNYLYWLNVYTRGLIEEEE